MRAERNDKDCRRPEGTLSGAKAETQGQFAAVANKYWIKQRQNRTEAAIREVKKGGKLDLLQTVT
jgi:hypothetical protein